MNAQNLKALEWILIKKGLLDIENFENAVKFMQSFMIFCKNTEGP
jgi:hypothetical protein